MFCTIVSPLPCYFSLNLNAILLLLGRKLIIMLLLSKAAASLQYCHKLPHVFKQISLYYIRLNIDITTSISFTWSRMLRSFHGYFTVLSISDFYWILFSIRLSLIFQLGYSRVFFKWLFRQRIVLLFRHSQNNYQMWLYKLNLICEGLSYQIINTSAVNQTVFCYY